MQTDWITIIFLIALNIFVIKKLPIKRRNEK